MKRPRVHIDVASQRFERKFLEAVARSRELHRPWGMPPSSSEQFRKSLRTWDDDTHLTYFLFNDEHELVGVVTLSQIVRGRFLSADLGYYAFAPHNGHGYMSSGLARVMRLAFATLGLHRLEANIQPTNSASIILVKRLGFRLEGFSKNYLKIAGRWRDHERWAITKEVWLEHRRRVLAGKKSGSSAATST